MPQNVREQEKSVASNDPVIQLVSEIMLAHLDTLTTNRRRSLTGRIFTHAAETELEGTELLKLLFTDILEGVNSANAHPLQIEDISEQKQIYSDDQILTRIQAADLLALSKNTITKMVKENKIIGFNNVKGSSRLPAWQFKGSDVISQFLGDILMAFNNNGLCAIRAFTVPMEPLGGKSLLTIIKEGDLPEAYKMVELLKEADE